MIGVILGFRGLAAGGCGAEQQQNDRREQTTHR